MVLVACEDWSPERDKTMMVLHPKLTIQRQIDRPRPPKPPIKTYEPLSWNLVNGPEHAIAWQV